MPYQFTRQAHAFQASHRTAHGALRLALETSGVQPRDTVLDVACGPGVLACAFAEVAQQVTGIDLTPQMLQQARQLQTEKQLTNMTWQQGDAAHCRSLTERFLFGCVALRFPPRA